MTDERPFHAPAGVRIRHSSAWVSFMPGVVLAVREVMNRSELVYGLDKLMGLM